MIAREEAKAFDREIRSARYRVITDLSRMYC